MGHVDLREVFPFLGANTWFLLRSTSPHQIYVGEWPTVVQHGRPPPKTPTSQVLIPEFEFIHSTIGRNVRFADWTLAPVLPRGGWPSLRSTHPGICTCTAGVAGLRGACTRLGTNRARSRRRPILDEGVGLERTYGMYDQLDLATIQVRPTSRVWQRQVDWYLRRCSRHLDRRCDEHQFY